MLPHFSGALNSANNHAVRFAWQELLSRVRWDHFLTLTLDPKRWPKSGPESWLKSVRWFLFAWHAECAIKAGLAWRDGDRLRGPWVNAWRHGRGQPIWVLALEPHRDDRLHAHVLLKLTRNLEWLDYSVGQALWQADRGICWFQRPRSQEHVSAYVVKYVVKCGGDALSFSPNFDAARMVSW